MAISSENQGQRELWCLVEGDTAPFPVNVPTNTHVAQLKKFIRDEGIAASDPVLAKDLTLWKVSHFQRVTDSR
jgi:hypothetical protein